MTEITANLAAVAFIILLDHLFRDPVKIIGIPHPVIFIGRAISRLERTFYPENSEPKAQFFFGLVAVCLLLILVVTPVWIFDTLIIEYFGFNIIGIFIAAWLIAARGLFDHVATVENDIANNNLETARENLLSLAGRNAEKLSAAAVLRTAGESLAENFSDAVVAPLLFYVLFGLPGIVAYKCINTLDSMWGYRNPRFLYFGRAAARLDDMANFLPARLSAFILLLAGISKRRTSYLSALRVLWQDARKHPSPNAGYPESVMAGLAGLRFGGPRQYAGGITEAVWLGDGREDWRSEDLAFCLGLYRRAIIVVLLITLGASWIQY